MGANEVLLCVYRYLEHIINGKLEELKIKLCFDYSRFLIILLPNRI